MLTGMAAYAQNYPVKPVRIVAATAGTTGDLLARHPAQQLNPRWGGPAIWDNRPGPGDPIGSEPRSKPARGLDVERTDRVVIEFADGHAISGTRAEF